MEDVFKTLDLSDDNENFRGYTTMIELHQAHKNYFVNIRDNCKFDDNNDSLIAKFAGNRLCWSDVIRPAKTVFGYFKT